MWQNPQETADLVTFTKKFLMDNFIFFTVFIQTSKDAFSRKYLNHRNNLMFFIYISKKCVTI